MGSDRNTGRMRQGGGQPALRQGYDLVLRLTGWITLAIALLLLLLTVALQIHYSPFEHPGVRPGADRVEILQIDAVRWLLIAIAGLVATMRRAPRNRDPDGLDSPAWIAAPLAALVGVLLMAAGATYAWLIWMQRLPGGTRLENFYLCGAWLAIPTALILTFAMALTMRPR